MNIYEEEVVVPKKGRQEVSESTLLLKNVQSVNAYQAWARWLAREDVLKKLAAYIFSENFHHAEGSSFRTKLANHLYFLFCSESVPQASRAALARINTSEIFIESLNFVAEKIWLPIFSGLLLHDGIIYFTQPLDRYGNRFQDILGGISPNQDTWSSHLGGDRPDTVAFWAPLIAPFVLLAGSAFYKHYQRQKKVRELASNPVDPHRVPITLLKTGDVVTGPLVINENGSQKESRDLPESRERSLFLLLWDKNLSPEEQANKLHNIGLATRWLNIFSMFHAFASVAGSFDERSLRLADVDEETLKRLQSLRQDALRDLERQTHTFGELNKRVEAPHERQYRYLPHYIYGNYLLWTLGQRKNILLNLVFLPVPFLVLYAKARLLEMFVQKILIIVEYFKQKKACESQHKQFLYMPEFAEYECTVCGDWPFVYYNQVFDSEGCLKGLLQKRRTPEEISRYLDQILKHPDFKTIDLTQQNWPAWQETQWEVFLNKIAQVTHELNTFNLSNPIFNPVFPRDGKIEDLQTFLHHVNVSQLDLHNQGIGDFLWSELVESLHNNSVRYLDISSNQLTDDGAIRLSQFVISSHTLKILKSAHNFFSDAGIQHLSPALANSSITELDVSDTRFSAKGVQALSQAISDKNNKLEVVDISGNDLSYADVQIFGKAAAQSPSLRHLDLSQTNFDDVQASRFMPEVTQGNITSLDFSDNPLTDAGIFLIVNHIQNSHITAIYFDQSALTDEGMAAISSVLNQTSLESISISSAKGFSLKGAAQFISHLPHTIISLDISDNNLGDGLADVFVEKFHSETRYPLKKVYLGGNQLTDKDGQKLVHLFALQNVTDLSLDDNRLTDSTIKALAEVFPDSQFTNLDFSFNEIANDTATKLLAKSFVNHTHIESLKLASNKLGDEAAIIIAKNLVTPQTPQIEEIGDKDASIDQIKYLRKTKPATNMTTLDLQNNQITTQSARALCRVLPNTKISIDNLDLGNNPTQGDVRNCQTSSGTRLQPFSFNFFRASEINLPENQFAARPAVSIYPAISPSNTHSNNNNNNNNSGSASAMLGAALFPGVTSTILALIAVYLLYRALSPVVRPIFSSVWEKGSSLFGKSRNLEELEYLPPNENINIVNCNF